MTSIIPVTPADGCAVKNDMISGTDGETVAIPSQCRVPARNVLPGIGIADPMLTIRNARYPHSFQERNH